MISLNLFLFVYSMPSPWLVQWFWQWWVKWLYHPRDCRTCSPCWSLHTPSSTLLPSSSPSTTCSSLLEAALVIYSFGPDLYECLIVRELAVVWIPFLAVYSLKYSFFHWGALERSCMRESECVCVCVCVCVQACMCACFNHYANPMSIICWSLVETVIFNIKELWNSVNLWCVYMWACVHVLSTVLEVIWNPSSMNCCLSQSC